MKTLIKILIISGLVLSINPAGAQTINWAGLNDENKNIINANVGFEYSLVYGLGYGRVFNTRLFPIVANAEYSFPSGKNVIDDFKTKIGGQIRLLEYHDFQFSVKIQAVFRRYENDFARLINFGSVIAVNVGYYRPKWFVAAEFGFDKAVVTHFKQSPGYKDQYPGAVSGWYVPTGGNYSFGLLAGYTFKSNEINIKFGKMYTQDFKTTPMIPLYAQIGFNKKF